MKINHSAVRGSIRFAVLTAFIASMLWRLYVIMKFGGTKDESQPTPETDDDDYDDDDYDGDTKINKSQSTMIIDKGIYE